MDIPSSLCVSMYIYGHVYSSIHLYMYLFAWLCLGICIYVLACLCVHMPGFSLLACSNGFPRLRFYFFDLDVLSLTLVIWEWMFAGRYVFRWGADCGSCAVLSVDEALLGAPRVVPWGSVGVVFNLP